MNMFFEQLHGADGAVSSRIEAFIRIAIEYILRTGVM